MNRFDDLLRTGGALAGRVGETALAAVADARAPRPGDEVGPFRIMRETGRGGMAIVFLAERADGQFQQAVALKWIHALAADGAAREMFRRERQILADLSHPGIARLLDGGETSDGQLWFAMPWIEGEAIDAWCSSQRLDQRARVRLVLQVAAALRFAHARLLVHCDVKASNILIDREGSAHLLDFGVARLAGPREDGQRTGHTPAVASPEQRAQLAIGVASDVYQLGLLLASLLGAVSEDVANDAAHAARLGGGDRRFRWPAGVAPELRAIVDRATRHEAAERFESAASFADDLQAWLTRRPVAAFHSGPAYVVRCFARRNPALSLVSVVSLALLLGLSAAFAWRLALERDQARAAADRAEAVSGFLVRLFRDVDPAANRIAAEAARNLVQRGETALSDGLATAPDVRAAVLATLGEVNQSLGDFAAAERLVRESLAEDPTAPRGAIATRQAQLAQALASRGSYDESLAITAAALAALGDRAADGAGRARLLAAQANAAQLKGDLALARHSAEALLGIDIDGAVTLEARAMARLVLAYVAEQGGDFGGALNEADAAVAPLALALGRDHPRVAALEAYRAYLLLGVGRHAEAGRAADIAVDGLSRVYGGSHARLSYALTNQALARLRTGDPTLALKIGERALSMCRETLSAEHAQCAVSAQVLATIAQARGDDRAALALLHEVLRVRRATLRADHSYVGFAELHLAEALCRAGNATDARAHLAEADRILATQHGDAQVATLRKEVIGRCG